METTRRKQFEIRYILWYALPYPRTGDKEILGAITGVTKLIMEITGFSHDQQNNSCLTGDQALIFEKRKGVLSWCCVRLQAAGYKGNYIVETKIHLSISK